MKKDRLVLIVYFLLLSSLPLWSLQLWQDITLDNTTNLENWSTVPMEQIYIKDFLNKNQQSLPYQKILVMQNYISQPQLNTVNNFQNETDELSQLLTDQMNDLMTLKMQWTNLQTLSRNLRTDNQELMSLLQESEQIIDSLQQRLYLAHDRVSEAEEGTLFLLQLNEQMKEESKKISANISMLQAQVSRQRRSATISFGIGIASFGAGSFMLANGLATDNSTMTYTGIGTMGLGLIVWTTGHYIFKLW